MSERARGWGLLGAVVAVGVALDQITKQLADAHLRGRGIVTVLDWATFNVADVLITFGLVFIVIDMFIPRRAAAPQPASSETST
jgi:lipoprotein signal peptidase